MAVWIMDVQGMEYGIDLDYVHALSEQIRLLSSSVCTQQVPV